MKISNLKSLLIGCMFLMGVNLAKVHSVVLEDLILNNKLESTLSHKKIGYYIGSFDPLHLGHEAVVHKVIDQKLCDYVLIYPAWGGDEYKNRTDVNLRLEMLFAAFKDHPQVIVTSLSPGELQLALMENADALIAGKPSVKTKIPGAEYVGIIGSDTAIDVSHDPKKLLMFMKGIQVPEKYQKNTIGGVIAIPVENFIVSQRVGDSIASLNGKFGDRPIIKSIQIDYHDISSTIVRKAVKAGEAINKLVSESVKVIIEKYGLYLKYSPYAKLAK